MCGEFGEVSGIIDLVINFLAGGTLFLNSYDTSSYGFNNKEINLLNMEEIMFEEGNDNDK